MGVDTSFDLARLNASVVHWVTEDTHQGCFVTDVQLRVVLWNRWWMLTAFLSLITCEWILRKRKGLM